MVLYREDEFLFNRIQELMREYHAIFSYGMAKDCICLGCGVYKIKMDKFEFEDISISNVIEKTWKHLDMEFKKQSKKK